MEIIAGTDRFYIEAETAVAIGKFDGVHCGHRRLIEELVAQKKNGRKACIFTFDPSPGVLFGTSDGKELTTREEKRMILQNLGVDLLIEYPLDRENASVDPADFVRNILMGQLSARFVAAGPDLSFGRGGKGDIALLRQIAPEGEMEVREIPKIRIGLERPLAPEEEQEADGEADRSVIVSSTLVRHLVEQGRMEEANAALGMPYPVLGRVEHGAHLGHSIGFPTINLPLPESKLLPPYGVYASTALICGRQVRAITNIGCKPTVREDASPLAETFLYDFSEEVYGEEVLVMLRSFRRPERKFSGLEDLRAQLARDIEDGRKM